MLKNLEDLNIFRNMPKILLNRDGSTLILSLLVLMVLSIIGISAMTSSRVEVTIAGNDRVYRRDFYVAESGWKQAVTDVFENPIPSVATGQIEKYFGVNEETATFPDNRDPDNSIDGIPYWFQMVYDSSRIVPGSGKGYREFTYLVTSNGNKTQVIQVYLSKIAKTGY